MRLCEIDEICRDTSKIVKFLQDRKVLAREVLCPRCNELMSYDDQKRAFRCSKRKAVQNGHKKRMSVKCEGYVSLFRGSWFGNIRIPLSTAMRFIGLYLMLNPPRQEFLKFELAISSNTVVDWSNYVREVLIDWCEEHSVLLGGSGKIVEIVETNVGHRKYNRGAVAEEKWFFGAFERDSKSHAVKVVEDRSPDTLLDIIKKWIRPGTTIISDHSKSCHEMSQENYDHLAVEHSINFANPANGSHKKSMGRTWRHMKETVQKYGARDQHFHGYFCEYLFKRAIEFPDRIETFFGVIARTYPPIATAMPPDSD
ncbi:uncharacterized protein [Fopius arisanus]|uniref:HI_1328.1_0 protein n=1 Tax=Fopius arisanus TaxID=64838 RepID=A0A0C9RGF6_9HYME|nr:PREDICTED: uncharacterized protein LOC105266008 [Fopius arisanus]XP_011302185.1 PREDICTED: uncharacterized protein LOC105266008 [Fopius arisanus]XP_011302186.1 PREDICTED: uncharacterized protein LOC105266008 [Fopius arisanus]